MKLSELTEYFEPSLYEMSNYGSTTTGLPSGVKLWVREEPKGLPHSKYRIKIESSRGHAIFAIWGDEAQQIEGEKGGNWKVSGKDLKRIQTFVRLCHNELRAHIDGTMDSGQLAMVFSVVKDKLSK